MVAVEDKAAWSVFAVHEHKTPNTTLSFVWRGGEESVDDREEDVLHGGDLPDRFVPTTCASLRLHRPHHRTTPRAPSNILSSLHSFVTLDPESPGAQRFVG